MIKRMSLWLKAIRDAFIILLPLTFFGVTAVLIEYLPIPGYQSGMTNVFGDNWIYYIELVINSTHGIFSLALAVIIAILITEKLAALSKNPTKTPPLMVGISTLMNFMLFMVNDGPLSIETLGHNSILQAIIIGVGSTELLRLLTKIRWLNLIRMSYETEATMYFAIRLSLPIILAGLITLALGCLLTEFPLNIFAFIAEWAQTGEHGAWWLNTVATLLNQAFWFLGIHGGHVLDAYAGELFTSAAMPYNDGFAWRPVLDNFVLLGGSGATLSLLVAIALITKEGQQRQVAKLSALPAIFNINESILYGLPIVLNPIYLIPFIGVPILLTLLTVAATQFGFLDLQAINLPWTTPPIISGWLLTGSWHGPVFQIVELAIGTVLYMPFVRHAEKQYQQRQQQSFSLATQVIVTEKQRMPVTLRQDQVGMIARGLLADFRADLKQGSLHLAYQPKHSRDGELVGVEALLRWPHARHNYISPELAVTLAEESGDIHRLGLWVLEQACACKERWNALGYKDLTMAVNVSPLQLTDSNLPLQLAKYLDKYKLTSNEIELEITESQMIQDSQLVDQTLQQLSDMEIYLAMDDFGMGYSSLLYLRRFPVHAIKIDGSLTRDVLSNSTNADIIRTIAALGHSRKVDVVAEFVETLEQRDVLIELGCNIFQGYYHSRPLIEEDCLEYFSQHPIALPNKN